MKFISSALLCVAMAVAAHAADADQYHSGSGGAVFVATNDVKRIRL